MREIASITATPVVPFRFADDVCLQLRQLPVTMSQQSAIADPKISTFSRLLCRN
jgi:hypothetical protein